MNYDNPFVLPDEAYVRDIDPIKHYREDTALYLSRELNISLEEANAFIKESIGKGGALEWHQPTLNYLQRDPETLDRSEQSTGIANYIYRHLKEASIIGPTLTTYQNSDENLALEAEFTVDNVEKRDVSKAEMFEAAANGDHERSRYKKTEQINYKTNNNGMSGAFVSSSTILANITAHSTLTSTCRVTAAIGSTDNERFISGARHYRNPEIVLYNMLSISNNTDLKAVSDTVRNFNLHIPTAKDVRDVIAHSTHHVWRNKKELDKLEAYAEKMLPVERAAFVYVGDFYQIKEYNEPLIRSFISELTVLYPELSDAEYETVKGKLDKTIYSLAWKIHADKTAGVKQSEHYGKGSELDRVMSAMSVNLIRVFMKYGQLLKTFFTTTNIPPSNAFFPQAVRHNVITGDTDSTIFTVQDWVSWYLGKSEVSQKAGAVAEVIVYMREYCVSHLLAVLSVNLGASKKNLRRNQMKNEFMFPAYARSEINKHYYSLEGIQEGFVNKTLKLDRKGVQYKSSRTPKAVLNLSDGKMVENLTTVINGGKISLKDNLVAVADFERGMLESLKAGSTEFYRPDKVKESEAYKADAELSPYRNMLMWNEIFGLNYGYAPEPPYVAFKVPVFLKGKKNIEHYLGNFKDQACAERFRKWFEHTGRTELNTLYVPIEVLGARPMPEDIIQMTRHRDVVHDVMIAPHLVLESLGYYFRNKSQTRLVSDNY